MPKRAPVIVPKEERDALISESSPYFVGNGHAVLSKFKCETRTPEGKIVRGDSITLLLVYCAYANHVNRDTGEAFPSYARLASILGVSTKTIGRALHELCDRGLLKIDRHMKAKGEHGYINVVRVLHADPSMTSADVRAIASYPQARIGHHVVPQRKGHHVVQGRVNGHDPTKSTNPVTDNQDVQMRNGQPECPRELSLTKNLQDKLQNAESVIKHWLAYAWKHGQEEPTADESDLATAHALVSKGITAEQLETAVIPMPESPRLQPLVRSLL